MLRSEGKMVPPSKIVLAAKAATQEHAEVAKEIGSADQPGERAKVGPAQEPKGRQDMVMAAGFLAAAAAVMAANPALAQDVQEAASAVADAAADAGAEDAEEVVGTVANSSGDLFEPLVQFNAGIIAGIDNAACHVCRCWMLGPRI
ncbi:ALB3.2 [Symbiodinium microadriaticum]|nr:ALB3.2 [Symbiodinium microadriaticum]